MGGLNKAIIQGVYVLYDKDEIVYVGKSKNIINRISSHLSRHEIQFDSFDWIECEDEMDCHFLEASLIRTGRTKYNDRHKGLDIPSSVRRSWSWGEAWEYEKRLRETPEDIAIDIIDRLFLQKGRADDA